MNLGVDECVEMDDAGRVVMPGNSAMLEASEWGQTAESGKIGCFTNVPNPRHIFTAV